MRKLNGKYELVYAPEGYPGATYDGGRYALAHHVVYWRATGVVPGPDEVVHHDNNDSLDNRPENLVLMTRTEHSRHHIGRGDLFDISRGPRARGEQARAARLTPDGVVDIRQRVGAGETQASIAREYGVTRSAISQVIGRQTWAHVA